MKLSKVHRLMLFTLGIWYQEAEKQIEGKPLTIAITKVTFIQALLNTGIAGKKERALYQNLEWLEKKRLISYRTKCLTLTSRGRSHFLRIEKEIIPYLAIKDVLEKKNPLEYSKKIQTRLSIT